MNFLERFKDITTFVFDVDGVLTNGNLLVLESGLLLRQMNVKDGYALKKAIEKGYNIAIITGGKSEGVRIRLQNLGIKDIYLGADDKIEAWDEYLHTYEIDAANVLYMGDDVADYQVMRLAGMPTCPADSARDILKISQYISPKKGGEGCVRDVIEKVMTLKGDWKV